MLTMSRSLALATLITLGAQADAFTLNSGTDSTMQGWSHHTVTFKLNPANCPVGLGRTLEDAMGVWNAVPNSDLVVNRGDDTATTVSQLAAGTATDVPVIICDPNFSADSGLGGNGVAGVARVGNPPIGGSISYAYLLINVEAGSTGNIATADATLVSVVLAHEMGHVLGLGHSADVNALMYYNASQKDHLALAQDDLDGISYLYPRNEERGHAMGCGIVAGGGPGPRPPWQIIIVLILFALPLMLAYALKRRTVFSS